MAIIIDGYNLISTVGIISRGVGPGSLQRVRLALLNFLAESLDDAEIAWTTVVFDAKNSPPGLPRNVQHRGLSVRFASRYPDADSLIEELIAQDSAPKSLTVVSSDHRIQRAARRRKAAAVDSDVWYTSLIKRRGERLAARASNQAQAKPTSPLLSEDVDYWIRVFGGEELLEEFLADELKSQSPPQNEPQNEPQDDSQDDLTTSNTEQNEPQEEDDQKHNPLGNAYNPFPPGYGEDLEQPDDLGRQ